MINVRKEWRFEDKCIQVQSDLLFFIKLFSVRIKGIWLINIQFANPTKDKINSPDLALILKNLIKATPSLKKL